MHLIDIVTTQTVHQIFNELARSCKVKDVIVAPADRLTGQQTQIVRHLEGRLARKCKFDAACLWSQLED